MPRSPLRMVADPRADEVDPYIGGGRLGLDDAFRANTFDLVSASLKLAGRSARRAGLADFAGADPAIGSGKGQRQCVAFLALGYRSSGGRGRQTIDDASALQLRNRDRRVKAGGRIILMASRRWCSAAGAR